MEVSTEAKRIMVVALGKLYSSRSQRGGLRLHRSLLLTLVMKSARDLYHEAQAAGEGVEPGCEQQHSEEEEEEVAAPGNTESPPCEELRGPASIRTLPVEEVVVSRKEDKENRCPNVTVPAQPSRKRRGKAAVEPDFLPCKKAKLEPASPMLLSPVLMDYVNCSGLGSHPAPMPIHRAIAVC